MDSWINPIELVLVEVCWQWRFRRKSLRNQKIKVRRGMTVIGRVVYMSPNGHLNIAAHPISAENLIWWKTIFSSWRKSIFNFKNWKISEKKNLGIFEIFENHRIFKNLKIFKIMIFKIMIFWNSEIFENLKILRKTLIFFENEFSPWWKNIFSSNQIFCTYWMCSNVQVTIWRHVDHSANDFHTSSNLDFLFLKDFLLNLHCQ